MADAEQLLNPAGRLLRIYESQLRPARKTTPLWARRLASSQSVKTREGIVEASPGDYLCRGVHEEYWPQKISKLLERYRSTGQFDEHGFEKFMPRLDLPPAHAVQVDHAFGVDTNWGVLHGKPCDYLVRSGTDPQDLWIVDRAIFEESYQFESAS